MAHRFLLLSVFFMVHVIISLSSAQAQPSFRPSALVLHVTKDPSTLQYVTRLNQRTPLVPLNLVLDLGGRDLWVDCDTHYVSSTYRPVPCNSAQCNLARPTGCGTCSDVPSRPGCNPNTCTVLPDNTLTHSATVGELSQDVISVNSTTGSNPGRIVQDNRFIFSCAHPFLLERLAKGASGMAGLGRTRVSLPPQFASAFSFPRKFALCLSSGTGVAFFGDGPYVLLPGIEISGSLTYTPLFLNPVSTSSAFVSGEPSADYFIGVRSIQIDGQTVSVNSSLLKIDGKGNGGTKISTVNPYTVLESSIFKAVTDAYVRAAAARNISRVAAVAPFETCFKASNVLATRLGAAVPTVTLVLQSEKVTWDIFGSNLVVSVNNDESLCLAFLKGGSNSRTSIVIGGFQIENNLLQFDLAASRLGFTSTLFGRRTTCANFNFTQIH